MSNEKWDCECGVSNPPGRDRCRSCGTSFEASERLRLTGVSDQERDLNRYDYIQTSSTPEIPGRAIASSFGLVTSNIFMGVHMFKDIAAEFRDVFGGRVASYEGEMQKGVVYALHELKAKTEKVGGNAIVGIRLDYEAIGKSILMVSAHGTAVKID